MTSSIHVWTRESCLDGSFSAGFELLNRDDLVEVAEPLDCELPKAKGPKAWLIATGFSANSALLALLESSGIPYYIPVNGLGSRTYSQLLESIRGSLGTILLDLRPLDLIDQAEQLTWASKYARPFAIRINSIHTLAFSFPLQPVAIIFDDINERSALNLLASFARLYLGDGDRPVSVSEADHSMKAEFPALSVKRGLSKGAILELHDLEIIPRSTDGLSPLLATKVVGKKLRYEINVGEALTFGHLHGDPQ